MSTYGIRPTHVTPAVYPPIPEPYASVICERCSFAWKDGRMRLKVASLACAIHYPFLRTA